jgi:phosphoserine phosphatase
MPTSNNVARTSRHNRIVLADWDNTLCRGYTAAPWAEYLEAAGLFRDTATLRAMLKAADQGAYETYDKFCDEMGKAYAERIIGISESDVRTAAKAFVKKDTSRLFEFTRELFAYFNDCALPVVVVTGAPDEPMREYAATLGFTLAGTFQLAVQHGRYTGGIVCNSGLSHEKHNVVSNIVSGRDVVMAFGDSSADVPLWDAAAVGFLVVSEPLTTQPHRDLESIDANQPAMSVVQQIRRRTATMHHAEAIHDEHQW